MELDLTDAASVRSLWGRLPCPVGALIFGVRLSLVWGETHLELARHLELLVRGAAAAGVTAVLHVSSVAVADHVKDQLMLKEEDPLPPIETYQGPYDRFKRVSEELLTAVCGELGLPVVHLRIGGIFSNGPNCIQCGALAMQSVLGCYSPTKIDFNSSKNVCAAIGLLLGRLREQGERGGRGRRKVVGGGLHPVYYYTRATAVPVPYGELLACYRQAHGIWYGVWLPVWLCNGFIAGFRWLAWLASWVATVNLLVSLDYLLTVGVTTHTFDNTRFRADFPEIAEHEESILAAFERRHRAASGPTAPAGASR